MNAVTKIENTGDLARYVGANMTKIKSVMAKHVTPEKMARLALGELRSNPFLETIALQNPASFLNAVVQASHLGLEIGGVLGQAYLVPFKGAVQMMVGYRGLISLARRSGEIESIKAECVYANDVFELELGIDQKVVHKPEISGERGDLVLVYMVAKFKGGGYHFEWMSVSEINKIKAISQGNKKGTRETPWDTHFDEMAKKTVIRRGWKYLPMSIEMQSAEMAETAHESGIATTVDNETGEIIIDNAAQDAEAMALKRVNDACSNYTYQLNQVALDAMHAAELDNLKSLPDQLRLTMRVKLNDAHSEASKKLSTEKEGAK